MAHAVALWVALAVFAAGIAYRASGWFRNGLLRARGASPWSRLGAALRGLAATVFGARRILALLEALVLDVLLQRRLLIAETTWPEPCCGARYLPAAGGLVAALLDVPSRYACAARSSRARLGDGIARLATGSGQVGSAVRESRAR